MNIFYLAREPATCAAYHCDKHAVKMITEYAQLLSTAIRITTGRKTLVKKRVLYLLDDEYVDRKNEVVYNGRVYKTTHEHGPNALWVRASMANFLWLKTLALELCAEYTRRYGREHKTESILRALPKPKLARTVFFPPPQVMPDDVRHVNAIKAYRTFYIVYKSRFAKWDYSKVPKWYKL